jgi:multidrug efflux pump subunit AcrA (membrane-fusion protein)
MNKYIILISCLGFLGACKSEKSDNQLTPQYSDIVESVYASVKVKPMVSYHPQPLRSGMVDAIFCNEGDLVEKGQILMEIDPTPDAENRLTNAQIDLEEAQLNYKGSNSLLKSIDVEIRTLKEQLVLDSVTYKRQERLWSQKIGSKVEYDKAKLRYQTTSKQLVLLQKKRNQTKTNLRNVYKKALGRTQTEKNLLDHFTIRAKMDGRVYSLFKEVGDMINSQEKFAEIGSADSFKLEMDIDEVDITKIAVGDSVIISLDAFKDQVFVARVDKIFPKKNEVTQTFRVESSFNEPPAKLYSGLAGEANIVVGRRQNALVIPTEYLISDDEVSTAEGNIKVKTGLKNLKFVEILSGIDTSTALIKPELK